MNVVLDMKAKTTTAHNSKFSEEMQNEMRKTHSKSKREFNTHE